MTNVINFEVDHFSLLSLSVRLHNFQVVVLFRNFTKFDLSAGRGNNTLSVSTDDLPSFGGQFPSAVLL